MVSRGDKAIGTTTRIKGKAGNEYLNQSSPLQAKCPNFQLCCRDIARITSRRAADEPVTRSS